MTLPLLPTPLAFIGELCAAPDVERIEELRKAYTAAFSHDVVLCLDVLAKHCEYQLTTLAMVKRVVAVAVSEGISAFLGSDAEGPKVLRQAMTALHEWLHTFTPQTPATRALHADTAAWHHAVSGGSWFDVPSCTSIEQRLAVENTAYRPLRTAELSSAPLTAVVHVDASGRARGLTDEEKTRLREMLNQLHAPPAADESLDEKERTAARLKRLGDLYPDVFELIGFRFDGVEL